MKLRRKDKVQGNEEEEEEEEEEGKETLQRRLIMTMRGRVK